MNDKIIKSFFLFLFFSFSILSFSLNGESHALFLHYFSNWLQFSLFSFIFLRTKQNFEPYKLQVYHAHSPATPSNTWKDNRAAHALAREAKLSGQTQIWKGVTPPPFQQILRDDLL